MLSQLRQLTFVSVDTDLSFAAVLVSSADLAGAGVLLLLVNLLGVFLGGLEGSLLFQNLLNGGRNLSKKKRPFRKVQLFPNPRTYIRDSLTDGAARIIIFCLQFFPTTLCRGRGWNPCLSVEFHQPLKNALPTEQPRHRLKCATSLRTGISLAQMYAKAINIHALLCPITKLIKARKCSSPGAQLSSL